MWKVEYDLAYDGGWARWSKLYRSRRGALIARWWNPQRLIVGRTRLDAIPIEGSV